MAKRKINSTIAIVAKIIFILIVFGGIIAFWVFWFTNCGNSTIADAPAVCLLVR